MKFLGEDAVLLDREKLVVNNSVICEMLEVGLSAGEHNEDSGMLYLYPVEDNQFYLQLYFRMTPDDTSINTKVCSLRFQPSFFDQYPAEELMANQPFRFDQITEMQFPVCSKSRLLIAQLQEGADLTPFLRSLQKTELALQLLRRALMCITIPFTTCQVPACRFLTYESEREKIQSARLLLEQNIDQQFTIKELARKVAMNECYLKKGFKAITGRTIHEYQQELRIEKAKQFLQLDGRSVTDVANILGYSSISHFSTAFKRITGMKPCELLA